MTLGLDQSRYTLRPLRREDGGMILDWRNDARVRKHMYTDHVISPEEHGRWFERVLLRESAVHYIFELQGEPIGHVGFSKLEKLHQRAEWTFHLRPEGAPRGSGSALGFFAIDCFFNALGMRKLVGEVLSDNDKSLKMHRNLGFVEEGVRLAHVARGGSWVNVHEFAILQESWPSLRAALCKAIFAPNENATES